MYDGILAFPATPRSNTSAREREPADWGQFDCHLLLWIGTSFGLAVIMEMIYLPTNIAKISRLDLS
jgi:hypothetical protein